MGKKGDGATSAKLVTTVATAGGVFVLRKVLATAWTKITGKEPPTDLAETRGHPARGADLGRRDRRDRGGGEVRHRARHDAQGDRRRGSKIELTAEVSGWPGPPASRLAGTR